MASKNLFTPTQSTVDPDLVGFHILSNDATSASGAQTASGGGITLSRDASSQVASGGAALKFVTDGTATFQGASLQLPASAYVGGQTYTFSVFLKTDAGTPSIRLYCESKDNGGATAAIGSVGTISPTTTSTRYTVTVTLPADLSGYRWFGLRWDTGGTTQAVTLRLDYFQVEQGAAATGWVLGQSNGDPTPLTVYGTSSASVTVPTALQLSTGFTNGAAGTAAMDSALGTATGFGEIDASGNASPWLGTLGLGNPSGNGLLLDTNLLEGQQIVIGSWTPTIRLQFHTGAGVAITGNKLQADLYVRFWIRNQAGIYTFIAQTSLAGQFLNDYTTYSLPSVSVNNVPFNAGDRLYIDMWANVTSNTGADGTAQIRVADLATSLGGASGSKFVTPGYIAQPPQITRTGGIQVVHAGQDITAYVDESTIDMTLALGQGPGVASGGAGRVSSMQFRARLGPVPLAKGAGEGPFSGTDLVRMGDIQIYDATGTLVFGGYAVDFEDATTTLEVQTQVTATDYWQFLDRIMINEVFAGQSDTQIISFLLTKYAPWVNQSALPTSNQYIFSKRFFRARTLRDTLQVVSDVTGYNIWISADKIIHYASLGSLTTAPFSVSDDPDYVSSFPHVLTKYVQDDTSIVNQVFFYGGRNLSADYTQDLSVQANGNSTGFAILYYPHEASDGAVHIKKNGVALTAYSVIDANATHKLIRDGGTADVLINYDSETLEFNTAPLKTDTLTIQYRYQTPLVLVLSSSKSFQKFGQYFQAKIVDQNVFDAQTALQRCRVLISEQAFGLTTLQLKTWHAGLQPGQVLYIQNTVRGLNDTFQVQRVQMKPLGAGFFEWTVDLGAWNWNLVDALIWQQRTADSTDDSIQSTESVIQAQETLEGSTVTVAWVKQVRASGVYYSRTTSAGDGHDAYSGFFSVTG